MKSMKVAQFEEILEKATAVDRTEMLKILQKVDYDDRLVSIAEVVDHINVHLSSLSPIGDLRFRIGDCEYGRMSMELVGNDNAARPAFIVAIRGEFI